ncbi:MAG: O-methyltransferase [Gemmatimonadales bacterium]
MMYEWIRTAGVAVRNAVLGSNLASWRLLGQPRSYLYFASEALFLLDALRQRRGLPERNVGEHFPDAPRDLPILLDGRPDAPWLGPVTSYLADLVALCQLCQLVRPRVVFEIGTFHGYSTLHFALNTPADAVVYSLDLPPDQPQLTLGATVMDVVIAREGAATSTYAFSGREVEAKIRLLHGDSAKFDFSPWHRGVDLFFIDGAHSYEYVRSDSERALECVRPGGVVAWHDFGRSGVNGVGRCLRELRARGLDITAVPGGSLAYLVVPRPTGDRSRSAA